MRLRETNIVKSGRQFPAIFLDRDGTLIEDRGHLRDPSEVEFYADTFDALRMLQERYHLFIVTNQPGVGAGVLTLKDVKRVNNYVVDKLLRKGVSIREVYACPHEREEGCQCIKPKPYFLYQAAKDHGIDLNESFVIGDHPHDVDLA